MSDIPRDIRGQPDALPSLNAIRQAHGWKRGYERYMPLSRFVFRPIGFLATWVAIRVRLTTEAVAWLSGVVGIAGCVCLASGYQNMLSLGIGLLLFFNLLDCVDGSIARAMKTENPYGRFLDSICGGIVDFAFWGVIGIMAFQHPNLLVWPKAFGYGRIAWMILGGLTLFLFAFLGYLERTFDMVLRSNWDRLQGQFPKKTKTILEAKEKDHTTGGTPNKGGKMLIRIINRNLRVRETQYLFLIVAYCVKALDVLLGAYFLYYLGYNTISLLLYTKRGKILRRAY